MRRRRRRRRRRGEGYTLCAEDGCKAEKWEVAVTGREYWAIRQLYLRAQNNWEHK
jgi:hypothetical protein